MLTHALSLLSLLCVAVCTASNADDDALTLVQVIHRHGARTPIVYSNISLICPTGCGMLNWEGKQMLVAQGKYLRQRYNGSALFPSAWYNPRVVTSRSTNILRTLQSAAGLLQGLFPNMTDYFPAISTVYLFTDTLLLVDAIPAFHIFQQLHFQDTATSIIEPHLRLVFNKSIVETIGLELSIDTMCFNTSFFVQCIMEAQDIAASYASTGVLSNGSFPVTLAFRPQLNEALHLLNSLQYPYNASSSEDRARGSLGQNVVTAMLQNMHAKDKGQLPQTLMHYSAHDTTVMPFAATLGNNDLMLPLFGTMYVLELWRSAATNLSTVRAYAAIPGQTPGVHDPAIESFPLHCIAANGTVYAVPAYPGSCPIDDFERFVNSSKPQSAAGQCYLSSDDFAQIGGNTVGSDQVPDPSSLLSFYRQRCPDQACPTGAFLNANLSCSTPLTEVDGNSITSPNAVIVGVASGLGGILLGVVIVKLAPVFWTGTKQEHYSPVNSP